MTLLEQYVAQLFDLSQSNELAAIPTVEDRARKIIDEYLMLDGGGFGLPLDNMRKAFGDDLRSGTEAGEAIIRLMDLKLTGL
jgi:hypothetical protein